MFKRLFWMSAGFCAGVFTVMKAQAYVKANTPAPARQFLLGPDIDNVGLRTAQAMLREFNETRKARESELNKKYADRRH
ncbi:hypothetical protein G1C98_0927 [Bifidobacterium sp. DSM 109960]|uniref:Secreted protein n=1 Tax=Bifidobacterium erythrocebi TaxID=2675325 RepID=A0A7Y0EVN6_9BIFI|nr:hypothetical protein [Bifidobacterium sp. DSM 109960]NMM96191.1 hypothetical protein [Bifidobacterium sp. DSM 109960]